MKFQKIIIFLLFMLTLALSASAQRRVRPSSQLEKAPGNAPNYILLSDDDGKYQHVHYQLAPWINDGTTELVFAAESDVNPDSTCAPSLGEIANWNAAELPEPHTDAIVYYNCTDDSTVAVTYVFYIDTAGIVVLLESPGFNVTRRTIPSPVFAVAEAPTEAEVWAYIQLLSPPPKPGTMFEQLTGAIPMSQTSDNPSTVWFYDGLHVTRIKDFPRKVEIPDNAFADTLNQTVTEVYTWLGVDTTYKGNYWLLYNVGAGTKDNPDWVYSVNGDYSVSNNDIVCIKKPSAAGNGGTIFTTTSPTNATLVPNTTPKNGDVLINKVLGSEWQRVAGAWVRQTNDNGFRVLVDNAPTVTGVGFPPVYTPNFNNGNRFKMDAFGDITLGQPTNLSSQKNGEIFVYDVYNTTEDYITISSDTLTFNSFRNSFNLPEIIVQAGETKILSFQVNSFGELVALASMNADSIYYPAGGGGGITGVTDQVNGIDPSVSGSNILVAPDINELPSATVASGDLIMIADVDDSNNPKKVTAGAIAALGGGGGITGVTDQVNGLDIAAPGGSVTVENDYAEVTLDNTYDPLDKILKQDNTDGTYKALSIGTYFGLGFVDLSNQQWNIAGDKGFTTSLHFGGAALPTGIKFGTATQTTIGFKGGTIQPLAESVYQDFAGLVIESTQPPGGGLNTTTFIATGEDASGGRASIIRWKVRPSGAGQNAVEVMNNSASGTNFGNASIIAGGTAGGIINVPLGGVGFEGGQSTYKITGITSQGLGLLENGNSNTFLSVGINGWQVSSDSTLKYDITRIVMNPAKIRRLHGYTFRLLSSDSLQMGVIAQEIQADFPEAVVLDSAGKLAVNPLAIAAIAAEAANNLQAQLDAPRDSVMTETASSPATARKFAILPVDSSSGPVTVNPPPGPYTAGDWFAVVDSRGTSASNNITVDFTSASLNLNGSAANTVVSTAGLYLRYTYVNSTVGFVRSN